MTATLTIRPARLCAAFVLAATATAGAMLYAHYSDIHDTATHLAMIMFQQRGRTPDTGELCAVRAHADLMAKFSLLNYYAVPVQSLAMAIPGMPGGYLDRFHADITRRRGDLARAYVTAEYDAARLCGLYQLPITGLTV